MNYEWDSAKNQSNQAKHGVAFDAMTGFDWDFAICLDAQFHGGEERELWIGPIHIGLFAVVVVERNDDLLRIISLRRATNHEKAIWKEEFYD